MSFAGLNFGSHNVKPAQLTLTPHHLFVLLSQIEELDVDIGPMNVRIESIHNESSPANYISFLQGHNHNRGRGEADSIHSVSSVRSVMSSMSALWSSIGLSGGSTKCEKARLALKADLKYVYGAFTKLPALRLSPDPRTQIIKGYEQFPFDTAVPLFAFKNLQQLEIIDLDFRSFHGWDRLADQLRLLTIKRGSLDDPIDVLEHIVLDDAEKRRRRSNRWQGGASTPSWSMPSTPQAEDARSHSDPGSPEQGSLAASPQIQPKQPHEDIVKTPIKLKTRSHTFVEGSSPKRPPQHRPATSYRHSRTYSYKAKRSGSGSSNSSDQLATPSRSDSLWSAGLGLLPPSKWQKLIYLSFADNGLTSLSKRSMQPVLNTLRSLNLSSNLFTEIPESLAAMPRLVSLDLSNCMIESLQNLSSEPLQAIVTLKLKSNRLRSLSGIEKLTRLENLDIRNNKISDPDEPARLTAIPSFKRLWIKYNPLTRSFPDYRVRIMNHFRKTSGFGEDIVVDGHPASFIERKQLVDRVEAPQPSDISELRDVDAVKPVIVQETAPVAANNASHRALGQALQRQASNAATARKKPPRRRMVDLNEEQGYNDDKSSDRKRCASNEPPIDTYAKEEDLTTPLVREAANLESLRCVISAEQELSPQKSDASADADLHKLHIEQLRTKFGTGWLNALNDQDSKWRPESDSPTPSIYPQPPQLHQYHSSPSVIRAVGHAA